jgi:two-component system, sporulation sensor kinase E
VKLTIFRMVAILSIAMVALIAFWETLRALAFTPSTDPAILLLVRGLSTGVLMAGLTAWLILRYRKRFEDELRRQSEECLRTRVFFENIVQDAGEAVISLDNDGTIHTWNRAAESIYGYTAREIIGRPLDVLVPPDLLEAGEPARILSEVRRRGCIRNYETRRVRKDGTPVLVRLTRSVLRDGEGNIIGSSAIVSDITLENALEARAIQAEKLAAIGQAAASTAHEVRNALAGIWGTIQILEKTDAWRQLPPDVGCEVHLQIARIGHIIDDLLAYARPSRLARQDADIHQVMERALGTAAASPDSEGRLAVREFCAGPLMAEVDPLQLEQAFQNLVINAYQSMERGGVLRIETGQEGDTVRITFRDSGRGMTSEMLSRALDPFFTTKARGTGLGLAIVRNIVEAHRGTIQMESLPGVGTSVTLRLPRMAAFLEEERAHSSAA